MRNALESIAVRGAALAASLVLFGIFCQMVGASAFGVWVSVYQAAFGSWYSWQNTLTRAAPLMLCALCTALPARAGGIMIGNEGAVVVGGLGAIAAGLSVPSAGHQAALWWMGATAMLCGAVWIGIAATLSYYRGVNIVITGLLLNYLAVALLRHLIEGPMRDPGSLNNPATRALPDVHRLGTIGGSNVHYDVVFGLVACLLAWILLEKTVFGFQAGVVGGNIRAANLAGIPSGRVFLAASMLGGACAGLTGMAEVSAVHGRANEALNAGYGYSGILVSFVARHNPAAVALVSILFGGLLASGGMLQRAHELPDSTVMVLEGIVFLMILVSDTLYGRLRFFSLPRTSEAPAAVEEE